MIATAEGSWLKRMWRYYFAFVFLWGAVELCLRAYEGGELVMALGLLLVASGCLIVGILLILPEAIQVAVTPIYWVVDSLFFPGEKLGRPPLDYRLAEFYGDRLLFRKAAGAYEHILDYYPGETQAYVSLVEIYFGELQNEKAGRGLMRRAKFYLTKRNRAAVEQRLSEVRLQLGKVN